MSRVAHGSEIVFVGIAVLRNDGSYPLGMAESEPEPDWCSVVEDVRRKPTKAGDLGEAVDHAGNIVECVSEFLSRRHAALAEAGEIRRDHMKSVGEERDQITEHVTCTGEAVQQQKLRRIGWSRFAIENLKAVDSLGLDFLNSIATPGRYSSPEERKGELQ
jgi:hypothetical protein